MRRVDVLLIGLGIFGAGGLFYIAFQLFGLDNLDAGIFSQVALVVGLMGWLLTYMVRALTKTMTLNQQIRNYEDAVIQKRWEELTPEEVAKLQAELEKED